MASLGFYEKQVGDITEYFKNSEKNNNELKIGFELEHIIVDKDTFKSITYYDELGVESTLRDLLEIGWNGEYTDSYLMGASKNFSHITLEPGAQLELSIDPKKNINELEDEYLSFINDIEPILERKNQYLLCIGYHPVSKISEIPFIPKKRYEYMSEYFEMKGKYAHNMMKGTASLQIAVDYRSEEDYKKKFRVCNALAPVMACFFDNSPVFEGEVWSKNALRTLIWNNCDDDRCMVINGALEKSFGYDDYAEYLLNAPPIIVKKQKEFIYSRGKLLKEFFDKREYDLNHIFTMYFPDVRTKNFIEIRMIDSLPYPLNLSAVALWKGIIYNDESLDELYDKTAFVNDDHVKKLKKDIIEFGLSAKFDGKDILELMQEIIKISENGLKEEEKKYLNPLKDIVNKRLSPAMLVKENAEKNLYEALLWCRAKK